MPVRKYKSLMDLKGTVKWKVSLEEIENAEAAVRRFEKSRRNFLA